MTRDANLFIWPTSAESRPCAKVKKDLKDGVTVTSLSPGQLNWLRGYWMGTPPQLQGAYPGSSAVLMERKGAPGGVLLWVRGSLYCNGAPVPPQFVEDWRFRPHGRRRLSRQKVDYSALGAYAPMAQGAAALLASIVNEALGAAPKP